MEPNWHYALVQLHGDDLEVHKFTLEPTCEQSQYRAIVSYNAFAGRNARQALAGNIQGYLAIMRSEADWIEGIRSGDRVYSPHVNPRRLLPQFVHASIWEFYSAVGYDYKSKKWLRPF